MALKPLNSVAGFSVGEIPSNVILANGDVTTTNITVSGKSNLNAIGNVYISGGTSGQVISTDGAGNLSFTTVSTSGLSNGTSNINVLNSSNITFSSAGTANVVVITSTGLIVDGVLSVTGNSNVGNLGVTGIFASTLSATGNITSGNASLGNLATANYVNVASNTVTNNLTVNLELSGNTANFTGNITALNANLGNLATANYVNVSQQINGNVANFTGNLTAANANLGNLATANFVNVSSNLNVTNTANVGNLRTDNLLYANGQPWDLGGDPGGSNTQIQYNDGTENFGASANLTFDASTSTLGVIGLLNVTGNANVSNTINGNVANFSGNLTAANSNLGNLVTANFANIASNVTTSNLTVNLELSGNTANFTGNITALNANLGNLATANYVNVSQQINGNVANFSGNLTAANANLGNLATANFINVASNVTTSNLTVNLALSGNTANFSGNVVVPNLTVNLELAGNTANFTGNVVAGNLIGTLANGTSNIRILNNANIELSSNGVANVVTVTGTGLLVAGNIQSTTGNILANGNVTANGFLVGANANVTGEVLAGSVKTSNIVAPTGNITISAAGSDQSINLIPTGNGVVDVANTKITNLKDPTADQDAATKKYVDDVAQGLNIHDSCYAATINTLATLTGGGTITYNNGTAGVGATLTLSGTYTKDFTTANTFDNNTTAVAGNRILVKNQANAAHNGIYVVTSATVLTRASDFNSVPEVEPGDFTFVTNGDTYNDTGWVQTESVTTIGTDPINFTQFSGAGTYSAGSGLTLTGSVFSVNVDNVTTAIDNGNVIVKTSANLTTPNIGDATFSSLTWNNLSNGNVTANNLSISNIANIAANLIVGGYIQANGTISSNANVSGLNITTSGNVQATGNVLAGNITANSTVFASNANVSGTTITNLLTVNNAFSGNTANFSGNVVVPNLTVNLELAGNTANFTGNVQVNNFDVNLVFTGNTANFSGNVVVPNLTVNLELAGNTANFSGNIDVGGILTDNYYYANGSPVDFQQAAGSNTQIQFNNSNDFGASANLTFNSSTNVLGVIGDANISNAIVLGNTTFTWATLTTTSITANQTIASLSVTGVTGIEYLVKAIDSSGSKYSVATVQAVTDGSTADYSTYGTVNIGGPTGTLAVNISGGLIRLQVTPSSSNSTVWVTQYRLI